jgi:NAD(P)-dependent dehydrogenase (short-subunit alcohol dehydrogenase family)
MGRLDGRVAIVTASAGSGGGQATLRRFAEEGAKVAVVDAHEKRTKEVAEDMKAKGYEAIGIPCDVTKWNQVKEMVDKIMEDFGRVDILVNNAGINKLAPLHEVDDETWDLVMNVNLRGTFYCSKAAIPIMRKQKYGRIVNISSAIAWIGSNAGEVPYTSAKAAIIGFTRSLALENVKEGITVNCIMPGLIPNPFLRRIYPEEELKKMEEAVPIGKGGEPRDIANATLFLSSDEAKYMTGCTLCVSGGMFMY